MSPVYGDTHVWEEPTSQPTDGTIIILGDQTTNINGTVEFRVTSKSAYKYQVSTSSVFSGAEWLDLPDESDNWKASIDISGESAGDVSIYYRFQNIAQTVGTDGTASGAKTILYDPSGNSSWHQIMATALVAIQRDYETYKLETDLPAIQKVVLGEPLDVSLPLPILGVEWSGGEFELTDGIQITGSFQTISVVFHVLAIDDVNVQNAYAKHAQLVKTLQGVCKVLLYNTTLDGLVSRTTPVRVDRVPYGAGRKVIGGEIHAEIMWQSNSI